MDQEKKPGVTRQAKYQEKLRDAVKELEILQFDVRASKRVISAALDALKVLAVKEANKPALARAIGHIESALLLLDADRTLESEK